MTPTSMMPFLIVEVTSPPARYAPANSNTHATITAWPNVNALEPTDVPIALATSLAPIPQAIKKPTTQPMIIKSCPYSAIISIFPLSILRLIEPTNGPLFVKYRQENRFY